MLEYGTSVTDLFGASLDATPLRHGYPVHAVELLDRQASTPRSEVPVPTRGGHRRQLKVVSGTKRKANSSLMRHTVQHKPLQPRKTRSNTTAVDGVHCCSDLR